jgi:hypothetical protein
MKISLEAIPYFWHIHENGTKKYTQKQKRKKEKKKKEKTLQQPF